MKYFTGDESGLIKCKNQGIIVKSAPLILFLGISFPPKIKERRPKKAKKNEGGDEKKEETPALQPLTGVFGKVDKTQAVQKLAWATLDDKKLVSFLKQTGIFQTYIDLVTGCTQKRHDPVHVTRRWLDRKRIKKQTCWH